MPQPSSWQIEMMRVDNLVQEARENYPPWIDIKTIISWINFCNIHHGNHCQSSLPPSNDQFTRPMLLIDVEENCLKRSEASDSYVALSYVWGSRSREEILESTEGNLTELLQPGAFLKPEFRSRIPKEILDAMHVTRLIGQKRLWCDRFCIVQDDTTSLNEQVNSMAYIYAHAYLTLVCTKWSSYNPGIHGLKGVSSAKSKQCGDNIRRRLGPDDEKAVQKALHHSRLIEQTPWNSRGWTLQEKVFSQRALFFYDETFTWECHCAVWHERETPVGPQGQCLTRFSDISRGLHYSPWPNLEDYARLVYDYSRRRLTFEKDVLRAFAGVTTALTNTFLGGFHFGLPRLFFDTALLWLPGDEIERRSSSLEDGIFPSWSWAGWKGEVDVKAWLSDFDYIENPVVESGYIFKSCLTHTISTVKWQILNAPSVNVSLQDLIRRDGTYAKSLGPLKGHAGWHKSGSHWQHSSDTHARFNYPIPIRSDFDNTMTAFFSAQTEISRELLFSPLPSCPYIRATTSGAHLWCVQYSRMGEASFARIMASQADDGPKAPSIGEVRSNDRRIGDSSEWGAKASLEFILLSEGYSPPCSKDNPRFRKDYRGSERSFARGEGFEYVNVMWIERVEGVAYRRGIGHVVKSVWKERASELDIVLG